MKHLVRPRRLLIALALIGSASGACQSTPPEPTGYDGKGGVPTLADYEQVRDSAELALLTRYDLERRLPRNAVAGVEAFAYTSVEGGRPTYADLVWKGARPVVLFQRYGGDGFVTRVKAVEGLLAGEAQRELERVFEALTLDDMEAIRRARRTPRAVLHEGTVRLSPELALQAEFFDGVLAYAELASSSEVDGPALERVVAVMDDSAASFARAGLDEPYFWARVTCAEALELGGESERAHDLWLQAVESEFWPRAPLDLQVAIRRRLESYQEPAEREAETGEE